MVAGLAFLIFVLTALSVPLPLQAATQGCLACHPVHDRAQGDCGHCHGGNPRTSRQEVAHFGLIRGRYAQFRWADSPVTETGRRLLELAACRRCHQSGGKGNLLASSLDQAARTATPEQLAQSIRQPGMFMPAFGFREPEITALVTAILAGAQGQVVTAQPPQVVYFAREAGGQNVFDKHCGGCHQGLSRRHGTLGAQQLGPNLSGLFTPFYPLSLGEDQPWTPERLEKWLRNPRALRKNARMPPVILQPSEGLKLLELLDAREVEGVDLADTDHREG